MYKRERATALSGPLKVAVVTDVTVDISQKISPSGSFTAVQVALLDQSIH